MIWRVSYDFQRPFWQSFGRVAFVKGDDQATATIRAQRLTALLEPGAEVTRLEIAPSTWHARLVFWRRVQGYRQWKRNVAAGMPNTRAVLAGAAPEGEPVNGPKS